MERDRDSKAIPKTDKSSFCRMVKNGVSGEQSKKRDANKNGWGRPSFVNEELAKAASELSKFKRKRSGLNSLDSKDRWKEAYTKVLFSLQVVKLMQYSGDSSKLSPLVKVSREAALTARRSQVGVDSVIAESLQDEDENLPLTSRNAMEKLFNGQQTASKAIPMPKPPSSNESRNVRNQVLGGGNGTLAAFQAAFQAHSQTKGGSGSESLPSSSSPSPFSNRIGFQFGSLKDSILRNQCIDILMTKLPKQRTAKDVELLQELVKQDSFFQNLTPQVRGELCRVMKLIRYDPDMVVFRQGDEGVYFYIILQGRVTIHISKDEFSVAANELIAGQSFGELALANDEPRTATIVTREDCEFLVIAKHDYRHILKRLQAKEMNEKVACFARLPYFSTWDRFKLMGLVKSSKLVRVPANFVICKQGSDVTHLYIIKKGSCRLIKRVCPPDVPFQALAGSRTARNCHGRKSCFVDCEFLSTGGFFGENGLLSASSKNKVYGGPASSEGEDKSPESEQKSIGTNRQYLASMVAERASEILVVRIADFLRFIDKSNFVDLASFAALRANTLQEDRVREKLANQIAWEREKHELLTEMHLPKYHRYMKESQVQSSLVPSKPCTSKKKSLRSPTTVATTTIGSRRLKNSSGE